MTKTMSFTTTVHPGHVKVQYPVHPRAIVMRFEVVDTEQMIEDRATLLELSKGWVGEKIPAYMACLTSPYSFPMGEPLERRSDYVQIYTLPYDHLGMIEALPKLKHAKTLRLERNFNSNPSRTPTFVNGGDPYTETKTYRIEDDGTSALINTERTPYVPRQKLINGQQRVA